MNASSGRVCRAVAVLLAGLAFVPGCIVQEIRDEMKATNAHLGTVERKLDGVDASLATANESLASVNSRIERTNASLTALEGQLSQLGPIETSLTRLDAHLAAVRKTIGSIDSTIPFLDLDGSSAEVDAPAPAAAPTAVQTDGAVEAAGATPAPDATPDAAAPAASTRRDGLIGPWIRRFPAAEDAVLLLPENRYIRIQGSGGTTPLREEAGRWSRDAATLTLTPGSPGTPVTPGTAPPASPPPGGAPDRPVQTYQILNSTARSVTLRAPTGEVLIFARP